MCWRTVRQKSYVAKGGVTASGYSAEYTREIRASTTLYLNESEKTLSMVDGVLMHYIV